MEEQHPIEGLMTTAMNSIKEMIDVNTIIGDPIETSNNVIIIPISKVGFGFAAGGSEFRGETIGEYSKKEKSEEIQYKLPFGGGSGAAVSVTPIAFLVVQASGVKLLPVNHSSTIDRLLDYVPDLVDKANGVINKLIGNKNENKQNNSNQSNSKKQEPQKQEENKKNQEDTNQEQEENPENSDEQTKESKKTSKIRKTVDKIDEDKQMMNKIEKNIVQERKVRNVNKKVPKKSKNTVSTVYEYEYNEDEDIESEDD